jgi:hypothetical protein
MRNASPRFWACDAERQGEDLPACDVRTPVLCRSVTTLLLLSSVACAPLVSRRKRTEPPPAKVAVVPRTPVREAPVVAEAPPPPPPKREPVVIARVEPPPPPPVVEEPEEPAKPKERNTFYAFTDQEIAKLKKRSKKFKKLHAQHRTCTSKSEKLIMRREQLREEIIELQNLEDRTPSEDKKLGQLRDEERRMKQDRAALAQCEPIEKQLTEMLQAEFGTTASLDEGVY